MQTQYERVKPERSLIVVGIIQTLWKQNYGKLWIKTSDNQYKINQTRVSNLPNLEAAEKFGKIENTQSLYISGIFRKNRNAISSINNSDILS